MNTSREIEFACTSCSLCCRSIGKYVKEAKKRNEETPNRFFQEFVNFPYKADENGACEKLGEDGKCTVYDSRPLVCSVSGMFKEFWSKAMTRKEYYLTSAKQCNEMIRENDYPEKFLVDESKYQ